LGRNSPPTEKTTRNRYLLSSYPNDCGGSPEAFDFHLFSQGSPSLCALGLLVERLNAAITFRIPVPTPLPEAIAPIDFSFEPPLNNWLEDTNRQNAPSPHLIVPVVMDRHEQRAKMQLLGQLSGSLDNVGD
jgi:hypothetical protein